MKKFFVLMLLALVLLAGAAGVFIHFYLLQDYVVFVESFDNGLLTVDSIRTEGTDRKFRVLCKYGEFLTVHINPSRSERGYYDLERLTVNGENVTNDVSMLQYHTKVTHKMTITATFRPGEPSRDSQTVEEKLSLPGPSLDVTNNTPYLGSLGAYNMKDPAVVYDEESEYYYAFCSDNVVVHSKDLINWTAKTNYFKTVSTDDGTLALDFDQFECVKAWAAEHGYEKDRRYSSPTSNRSVLSPEIIRLGKTYYLYFAVSKAEEANEAAIFCVKTNDLETAIKNKKWTEVGLVLSTCGYHAGSVVNQGEKKAEKTHYDASYAVHPSVFRGAEGGLYMAYGGSWGRAEVNGALWLLELDPKTGLLKQNSEINASGDAVSTVHGAKRYRTGVLIARPGSIPDLPKKEGSLVWGAEVVRRGNYYYLFMTYGTDERNSSVRVARSESPAGPYFDSMGNNVSKFESLTNRSQFQKGDVVLAGYNFDRSNNGGVAYGNAGKAAAASPSIFKTADDRWIMATHSQIYYKVDGNLETGWEGARDLEESYDAKPAMEMRQLLWDAEGWPLAVPEAYDEEQVRQKFKASQMYGEWDVVIFDKEEGAAPGSVGCNHSQTVSILSGVAITKENREKSAKLDKLWFAKRDSRSFELRLNGETFVVYPVVAWDWELEKAALTFTGRGDRGNTVWGKKSFSPMMGLYTDTLYYLLNQLDETVRPTYDAALDKLEADPTQTEINKLCTQLIKTLLAQ